MNNIYHLIFKNGSISDFYEDFEEAYAAAIEFSEQNEEGCALYSLRSGKSLFFHSGKQITTWIDYETVQYWFADNEEENNNNVISIIDHCLSECSCKVNDDELESFLSAYLTEEQMNQLYSIANTLKDYVTKVELFELDIQIYFSSGIYVGFMF